MFITELYEPLPELYHSERDDQSVIKLKDLRKTRLTLGHLNKLRMSTDIRKFEKEEEIKTLQDQYKAPAADAGAAPPSNIVIVLQNHSKNTHLKQKYA